MRKVRKAKAINKTIKKSHKTVKESKGNHEENE